MHCTTRLVLNLWPTVAVLPFPSPLVGRPALKHRTLPGDAHAMQTYAYAFLGFGLVAAIFCDISVVPHIARGARVLTAVLGVLFVITEGMALMA